MGVGSPLLVMGSPSVDLLHFRGRSERTAGGAGLYTALAARRAGARVTMVAPRPDPMPPELVRASELLDWRGPTVSPDALPHFEIEHEPGGKTRYIKGVWGSEGQLTTGDIPDDLEPGFAYVVPMMNSSLQVELAARLKELGWIVGCGTYGCATREQREAVRRSLAIADAFFCNENEAIGLFGDVASAATETGKVLFVTRGERGARVVQGDHATDVPPVRVEELDPTGAGDTFSGTTLALLARGQHPVIAARHAVAAAADMVTGVGPARLLEPGQSPPPATDKRVTVDLDRCTRVASVVATAPEATAFDFTGPDYPEPGDPVALDFFFTGTLQQFGFWSHNEGRYGEPMIAPIDGRDLKGSDYLWAAYRRWARDSPAELAPAGQAALDDAAFDQRLASDDGHNPLPAGALHPSLARSYGTTMVELGWSPESIVTRASGSVRPVAALLALLEHVGGYREDPLRKKSALLAAILSQRPEAWIRPGPDEDVPPIIDYHCMRSCLRLGLVVVRDVALRERLADRVLVDSADEAAVRHACYEAVQAVHAKSGRPMGAVDWFFFQNRRRCPEMTEPICSLCPADTVCRHERELFQPVFRTNAY